jgi:hypothetical protein
VAWRAWRVIPRSDAQRPAQRPAQRLLCRLRAQACVCAGGEGAAGAPRAWPSWSQRRSRAVGDDEGSQPPSQDARVVVVLLLVRWWWCCCCCCCSCGGGAARVLVVLLLLLLLLPSCSSQRRCRGVVIAAAAAIVATVLVAEGAVRQVPLVQLGTWHMCQVLFFLEAGALFCVNALIFFNRLPCQCFCFHDFELIFWSRMFL